MSWVSQYAREISACLAAFFVVLISMPVLRGLAYRYRIVDFPSKRKVHKVMTPLLGGVAIYLGFIAGLALSFPLSHIIVVIIAASTLILVLGLIDDIWGLSARFRLVVQLLAALVVVIFGGRIEFLPAGAGNDILEYVVSLVWIIGITNAFNYLDGLDGLASGAAVINLSAFAIILYMTSQRSLVILTVVLTAACIGFLPYNFASGRKKVFLGDAGSTFLGFVLAGVGLCGYWAEGDIVKIAIPILILGVPIFDMVFTTVMRIAEKKIQSVPEWLKYAGKDHFHHYLVDIGLGRLGAVIFIYCTILSLGLSAIIVSRSGPLTAILSIFQGFIIFGIIGVLIVMGKRGAE